MTDEKTKNLIQSALDFDPIQEAEDFDGGSLSSSLLFTFDRQEKLERLLSATGDTLMNMPLEDYMLIVEAYGFDKVFESDFNGRSVLETEYVYWHDDGFLLYLESYSRRRVNRSNIYYNIAVNQQDVPNFCCTVSSGKWCVYDKEHDDFVWVGDHDAREALLHKLNRLCSHGDPLSEWRFTPHIWLLNYMESSGHERLPWAEQSAIYDRIRDDKIAQLPTNLRDMIRKGMK